MPDSARTWLSPGAPRGLHGCTTGLRAGQGQGLLGPPASGWEDSSAPLSLPDSDSLRGPLAAELAAAKAACRHEACSLEDASRRFMEDEGRALTVQGSWAASALQAAERAPCGHTAGLSLHQLLPWYLAVPAPAQQLGCQHEHRGVSAPLTI